MKLKVTLYALCFLTGLIIMRVKKGNNCSKKTGGSYMTKVEATEITVSAEIADVADWFLLKEPMSNKKIQKLCYYAEAWSEAKLDAPISKDSTFEAWVHGPVNMELYKKFRRFGWKLLKIDKESIKMAKKRTNILFCDEQKEVLEAVWETYGEFSADELEALTHKEEPWLEQRKGLTTFENSRREINPETMKKYYRSIAID